jgi:hypothetical protein
MDGGETGTLGSSGPHHGLRPCGSSGGRPNVLCTTDQSQPQRFERKPMTHRYRRRVLQNSVDLLQKRRRQLGQNVEGAEVLFQLSHGGGTDDYGARVRVDSQPRQSELCHSTLKFCRIDEHRADIEEFTLDTPFSASSTSFLTLPILLRPSSVSRPDTIWASIVLWVSRREPAGMPLLY